MKKIISILFVLIGVLLINQNLISEEKQLMIPTSIGIYGGLNVNMHSPSFNYTSENLKVPFNDNSNGFGSVFGFIGLFPINNIVVIKGEIGYNGLGSLLSQRYENEDYEINASLNYIEISPSVQFYNLLPIREIYLTAGLETGVPLSPKYTFSNSKQDIVENESIPDAAFRMAGTFGAGYVFQLSKGINLTPELTMRIPFSKVSDNEIFDKWEVPQIRFGVSITFAIEELIEEPEPYVSQLNIGFKELRYYDKEGNFYPLERIRVEDVKYTEQFPIVPYVFFDEFEIMPSKKSQSLKAKSKAGLFTISQLQPDALEINNSTLDIIGTRMVATPRAELTITGTTDNMAEKENDTLALKRAEYTKKYLVNNFDIHPEKINVRAVGMPEKPSALADKDGIAENRRIELSSSNPKILEPLIIQKENQTLADPNLIEFLPFVESTDSILEWKLTVTQKGDVIRVFGGDGEPGYIPWVIIPNELVKSEIPLEYTLWVKNVLNIEKEAAGTIPVDYFSFTRKKADELPDKTISKFSLILFDFDADKISDSDLEIVNKDILPLIKFNSTVKIYGYTDRIGVADYNKKLAMRRAESIMKYLKSKVKTAKYSVFGVGENEVLYDNDLPIGRQLSRTVQIYILTPR